MWRAPGHVGERTSIITSKVIHQYARSASMVLVSSLHTTYSTLIDFKKSFSPQSYPNPIPPVNDLPCGRCLTELGVSVSCLTVGFQLRRRTVHVHMRHGPCSLWRAFFDPFPTATPGILHFRVRKRRRRETFVKSALLLDGERFHPPTRPDAHAGSA